VWTPRKTFRRRLRYRQRTFGRRRVIGSVDRRFLAMRGEARIQFLKSVAALVHTNGTKVVVEGVESVVEHDVVTRRHDREHIDMIPLTTDDD
jgi:hypothetical protein